MAGGPARAAEDQLQARTDQAHPGAIVLWAAILAGIPAMVAWHDGRGPAGPFASPLFGRHSASPRALPPPVEPLELYDLTPDEARAFNAGIPFSTLPNPAARPFRFVGSDLARRRAVDCLAAAQLYEAGDDPPGERAVAQVVLNRLRHPAFPKTVCGVVFQGSERTTGCQFTFTCDGALARTPSQEGWDRARALADKALSGAVDRKVGYSTHYHTNWVVPYWSGSLDKVTAVGTHLFFRWTGWWGTPPAFRRTVSGDEPAIPLIARLSPAHDGNEASSSDVMMAGAAEMAAAPIRTFGPETIGLKFGGAWLNAVDPNGNGFAVTLDKAMPPDSYPTLADTFCGGRQQCRVLAWMPPAPTPRHFPIDPAQLDGMTFSYIHDVTSGLQRSLWNCRLVQRANAAECMIDRMPAPMPVSVPPPVVATRPEGKAIPPGQRPPERYERVVISPPGTPRAPAP